VLGGTQSLHANGRDEALALPTEDAARLALRTQQIIAAETGVANTVDPCGGSWTIERRTDEIEQDARALIAAIDASGGMLANIEAGRIQRQIQDAAYAAQQAIDRGDAIVVGVNRYVDGEVKPIELHRIDPLRERQQAAAVQAVRARRDAARWRAAIEAVERAARDGSNLVSMIVAAVEADATLGEISDAMRRVFGEHREILS
jgi:methylmalonyl-CoA mutase N-terminal domain/subunit